jgi:hypothetical protein
MRRKSIALVILGANLTYALHGQCEAIGPRNPTVGTNDASIGTVAWSNPGNVSASDLAVATASAMVLGNNSNYLSASAFGFSIPASAIICGITVQIQKNATGLLQNVTDNSVKIIKNGVIGGSERALGGTWPTTEAFFTYGGGADLWGQTWTAAEINAGNFGVAISANLSAGSSVNPSARVNNIRISVAYNAGALPIELAYFEAVRTGTSTVVLAWATSSENNNDYFGVEHSLNGNQWKEIGRVKGVGKSTVRTLYTFTDTKPSNETNYYRLKQVDLDGKFQYLKIASINPQPIPEEEILIYPAPTTGVFTFQTAEKKSKIEIVNYLGELIYYNDQVTEKTDIDLSHVTKDVYFIKIESGGKQIIKKVIIK